MKKSIAVLIVAGAAANAAAGGSVALPGIQANHVAPVIGGSAFIPTLPAVAIPAIPMVPQLAPQLVPQESVLGAVQESLANLPNLQQASGAEAINGGARVNDAMTGENTIRADNPTPVVPTGAGDAAAPTPEPTLQQRVAAAKAVTDAIRNEVSKLIVGNQHMIDAVIMALVAQQHVLIEGLPGVGKTETVKAFASAVDAKFNRVDGKADMMPSDILGSRILQIDPETGRRYFETQWGPIVTNILLSDEINRMPPKAQSGVLQPMQEKIVTIEGETRQLPHFTVIATQNPVEQDGTYPLPEAQLDRFMFKVLVSQPNKADTILIGDRVESDALRPIVNKVTDLAALEEVQRTAEAVHLDDDMKSYIADIAMAASDKSTPIGEHVVYSVYTRANYLIRRASRIHAVMQGRDHVLPSDVIAVAPMILRHRIVVSFAAGVTPDQLIEKIIQTVPLPQPKKK